MAILNSVNTSIDYTYEVLEEDISKLKSRYPFMETGIMGTSVLGKNLSYVRLGEGKNNIFINGSHNSLEWITSVLLMKFIEDFCRAYENDEKIGTYDIKQIWENSSIYIVPMVNPDGIDLVLKGIESIRHEGFGKLVKWNNHNSDFSSTWQANIKGVDLNHNYNAYWSEYKLFQIKNKITGPGFKGYSGQYPESEPESSAIADFTRYGDFSLVLTLNGSDKEIYWNYKDISKSSKDIAMKLSEVSGYDIKTPKGVDSLNGYNSWFIETFRKPAFTVGVGGNKGLMDARGFDGMYGDILEILLLASTVTG